MNYPDGMTERDFKAIDAMVAPHYPAAERRMSEVVFLADELTDDEIDGVLMTDVESALYDALRDAVEAGRDSLRISRDDYWLAAHLYRLSQIEGLYIDDVRRAIGLVERMNRSADVLNVFARILYERFEKDAQAEIDSINAEYQECRA